MIVIRLTDYPKQIKIVAKGIDVTSLILSKSEDIKDKNLAVSLNGELWKWRKSANEWVYAGKLAKQTQTTREYWVSIDRCQVKVVIPRNEYYMPVIHNLHNGSFMWVAPPNFCNETFMDKEAVLSIAEKAIQQEQMDKDWFKPAVEVKY